MSTNLVEWTDSALARALRKHVEGEVGFDRGSRALYVTDAGNYRHEPIGVVTPRTIADVIAAIAICREHGAPVLPRGGGTSLAGQSCNRAVILDCSRHLRKVEIDRERGIARVEPGLVLDHLRDAARAVGWDFGPDPSTHDRCTLGGMLGNDSCGVHSVMSEFYGPGPRTGDHVETMDVLTYRGEHLHCGRGEVSDLRLADGLRALADRHADAIRARFPDIPRRVSGYNLPDLLPENGFHVARALVGSEATLVTILGAELRLITYLPARVVLLLGYPDIYTAAEHVPPIRALRPVGLEAFDHELLDRLQNEPSARDAIDLLPEGKAWLMVEHGAATIAEAHEQAQRTLRELGGRGRILDDKEVYQKLTDVREAALGTTAMMKGEKDAWEGWEDAAVPVAALPAYLRGFHALLAEHGYRAALYGHFGQGCVHVRIDFDLRTSAGIDQYARFTDAAARLVVAHGGSLSGEHGDGQSRSDLLPLMFGDEIVGAFGEMKALFDPDHAMNPGRIVRPMGRTEDLRVPQYHPHPGAIVLAHGDDGKDFGHAALRCVGVGKCRKTDAGTMCPSYMVTRDERHSTRGRAHLLYEMLDGELIEDGWRSKEVEGALDLCLSCKACKSECPMHVDMASYKAEFLAHHYRGRLRPRHMYALGWIHRWLYLGRAMPRLANLLAGTRLAKWAAGIAPQRQVPRLARRSFRTTFTAPRGQTRVILWPDTWNDAFYPEVLHATVDVLAAAGCDVHLPPRRLCCGRPLIENGWIDSARRLWERTFADLADDLAAGTPIVVVEPSCAATFRDEVRALFPDHPGAQAAARAMRTLAEFLEDRGWTPPPADGEVIYHAHCHQSAVLSPAREIDLMTQMGLDVTRLDSGCCGMAGPFGFQKDKYELSVALAERVLLPAVRANPALVADGFSCREQVRQLAGVRARHVAEIIAERLQTPR